MPRQQVLGLAPSLLELPLGITSDNRPASTSVARLTDGWLVHEPTIAAQTDSEAGFWPQPTWIHSIRCSNPCHAVGGTSRAPKGGKAPHNFIAAIPTTTRWRAQCSTFKSNTAPPRQPQGEAAAAEAVSSSSTKQNRPAIRPSGFTRREGGSDGSDSRSHALGQFRGQRAHRGVALARRRHERRPDDDAVGEPGDLGRLRPGPHAQPDADRQRRCARAPARRARQRAADRRRARR